MGDIKTVLTGDLIGSTKAGVPAVEQSFVVLSECASILSGWTGMDTRLTRSRGDGWQMLLDRPGLWLRASLLITARLRAAKAVPTRIAVGIGSILSAGGTTLGDAGGAAFERSGHALDQMPARARFAIWQDPPDWPTAAFALADAISRGWTAPQAEAAALALSPDAPSQDTIAQGLGITQQAAAQRLGSAQVWSVQAALDLAEAAHYK